MSDFKFQGMDWKVTDESGNLTDEATTGVY